MIWRWWVPLGAVVLGALLLQPVDPQAEGESRISAQEEAVSTATRAPENEGDPVTSLVAVTIGGEQHLLLLEETGLSVETRTAIAGDIERAYGPYEVTVRELFQQEPRWTLIEKEHHLRMYTLDLMGPPGGPPEVLKEHCRRGIRHGSTFYLFVHEKVIQEYQEAFRLRQEHREAFDQFDEFVALFNDREARKQAAETIGGARRFFYFHQMVPWDSYEQYARDMGLSPGCFMRIERPSVLDFGVAEELDALGVEGLGDALLCGAVVRFRYGSKDRDIVEKLPFIYADGKWHFLLFPM